MSDDKHLRKAYSWATTLKSLRNKKHLRPLEHVMKDFQSRITELEKAQARMREEMKPKKRGRPPKKKQEGEDAI